MALDYRLKIEVKVAPQQALQTIVKSFPFLQKGEECLYAPEIWVKAYIQDDPYVIEQEQEDFGFIPALSIYFQTKPIGEEKIKREQGERLMMRIALAFLKEVGGKGVLSLNTESIIFQKLNNQIEFNEDFQVTWMEEELKNASVPYVMKYFPVR